MSIVEIGEIKVSFEGGKIIVTPHFYNASDIAIKHIEFTFVPYDANNNVAANKYTGEKEFCLEWNMHIPPKYKTFFESWKYWNNTSVRSIKLSKIRAVYFDNSVKVIDGKDIVSMDDKQSAYYNDVVRIEEEKRAAKERVEAELKKRKEELVAEWRKQEAERKRLEAEREAERERQKAEKRAENLKKIKRIVMFWKKK